MTTVHIIECDFCGARREEPAGRVTVEAACDGVADMPTMASSSPTYDCCGCCAIRVAQALGAVREAGRDGHDLVHQIVPRGRVE